ncbi:MAG: contractile injection system protein, VgrG/Pvc8 family, partial [Myxococcota bacterium]
MRPTRPYTAQSGDWLAKVAQDHGTTVAEIWNHPDNAAHRAKRGSPDVLYPGDVVHVPFSPSEPVDPPPPPSVPTTRPPQAPPIAPPPGVPRPPDLVNLAPYCLLVEGVSAPLAVVRLRGRERLSGTYRLRAQVELPRASHAEEDLLLGRRYWLHLPGTRPRLLDGVVQAVTLLEPQRASDTLLLGLSLVPQLARLRLVRRSRIFQNTDVPTVIQTIFFEARIPVEFRVDAEPIVVPYLTQYEETDYAFVLRIAAKAGLFFYFARSPTEGDADHAESNLFEPSMTTRLVFSDSALGYQSLDAPWSIEPRSVSYVGTERFSASVGVSKFRRRRALASTSTTVAGYDPLHPNLSLRATSHVPDRRSDTEPDRKSSEEDELEAEYYEHNPSSVFVSWSASKNDSARRVLDERRRGAEKCEGRSNIV